MLYTTLAASDDEGVGALELNLPMNVCLQLAFPNKVKFLSNVYCPLPLPSNLPFDEPGCADGRAAFVQNAATNHSSYLERWGTAVFRHKVRETAGSEDDVGFRWRVTDCLDVTVNCTAFETLMLAVFDGVLAMKRSIPTALSMMEHSSPEGFSHLIPDLKRSLRAFQFAKETLGRWKNVTTTNLPSIIHWCSGDYLTGMCIFTEVVYHMAVLKTNGQSAGLTDSDISSVWQSIYKKTDCAEVERLQESVFDLFDVLRVLGCAAQIECCRLEASSMAASNNHQTAATLQHFSVNMLSAFANKDNPEHVAKLSVEQDTFDRYMFVHSNIVGQGANDTKIIEIDDFSLLPLENCALLPQTVGPWHLDWEEHHGEDKAAGNQATPSDSRQGGAEEAPASPGHGLPARDQIPAEAG